MAHKNKKEPGKLMDSGKLAVSSLKFSRGTARGTKKHAGSLKQQMRGLMQLASNDRASEHDLELAAAAERWFKNKRVNVRKPQKGIGRTNRLKTGGADRGKK
jgi:hypothetical protein